MDAEGNRYGPYDIEIPGSEAEAFTEDAWYEINRETGMVSGGDLTFAGLTATLSPLTARVHGSYLVREDPWSDASDPTSTSAPRRDMLVARRQRTSGEGEAAVPGKTFLTLLQGTPASTPADPTFDPDDDEPLWSWQVPGGGGTVATDVRDLRKWLSQSLQGAPIAATLRNIGGHALPAGWTTIPFTLEDMDTHGGHSPTTNNTRWYAPATRIYVVSAVVSFSHSSASSLTYRGARIRKSGVVIPAASVRLPVAANGRASIPVPSVPVLVPAGDYLDVQGYHGATDAITTYSDSEYTSSLSVFSL